LALLSSAGPAPLFLALSSKVRIITLNDVRNFQAEREANELRAQKEEEEKAKRILEAKEAEAAVAYAQSQQAYIAHHQAALEKEQHRIQAQQKAAQLAAQVVVQQQQQQFVPQHVTQVPGQVAHGPGDLNAENVFKEMVNVVMGGAAAALGTSQLLILETVTQQPPPSMPGAPGPAGPPPQLWGNTKVTYDMKECTFLKRRRTAGVHVYGTGKSEDMDASRVLRKRNESSFMIKTNA
ncbi:hypothetical protein COOONC_17092, partial [Cooperia oncophora]